MQAADLQTYRLTDLQTYRLTDLQTALHHTEPTLLPLWWLHSPTLPWLHILNSYPEPWTQVSDSLGGLDVLDFVNLSNPVSAALTTLLTAAAPTVQAAATTAVAVSAAVSAGAAAAGGAAAGGSVGRSVLGVAQRNSLMGTLGGAAASCDDPRATGTGGGWTMGRLGVGSANNPCTNASMAETSSTSAAIRRRRLTKASGGASSGGGGAGAKQDDEVEDPEIMVSAQCLQPSSANSGAAPCVSSQLSRRPLARSPLSLCPAAHPAPLLSLPPYPLYPLTLSAPLPSLPPNPLPQSSPLSLSLPSGSASSASLHMASEG